MTLITKRPERVDYIYVVTGVLSIHASVGISVDGLIGVDRRYGARKPGVLGSMPQDIINA